MKGTVASAAALSILLAEGIGDTIRTSLTPTPGGDRADEVRICQQVLQSLGHPPLRAAGHLLPGLRAHHQHVLPGAGRPRHRAHPGAHPAAGAQSYPGVETLRVAVMGCVVNGPGESRHADIGISLPGTGEDPRAPVFVDGKLAATLKGDAIAEDFVRMLDEYVERRFGAGARSGA